MLLGYTDFQNDPIVDEQHGYERAFFDNYRNEIIFIREGKLEYLINGKNVNTQDNDTTGYIKQIVLSPDYQIGIEILDIQRDGLGQGDFYGERTRIIDLSTRDNVIVEGVMFAHAFIANHYLYNIVFDYADNEFLDIINLQTMEHTRIKTGENNITFLYQIGERVYAQVESKKTAFLLDGEQMIETPERYNKTLPNLGDAMEYIDDIAPLHSRNHWYVEPNEIDTMIKNTRLLNIYPDGRIDETIINFKRNDIIQILDVTNYKDDKVALCYYTKNPTTEEIRAYVAIYNLDGEEVGLTDITAVDQDDSGRFMYLDYVE